MLIKYPLNTFLLIYDVRAEKRPHEWLEGVLRILGLAPSARTSKINRKVLKGYVKWGASQWKVMKGFATSGPRPNILLPTELHLKNVYYLYNACLNATILV